ncbi:MAG: hypothetical protein HY319_02335 [Armatimonadetes bacterium]|nr:hypothetical protein [Armatimonadota bacterium]
MKIAQTNQQPPKTVPYEQNRYAPVVDSWEVGQQGYPDTLDLLRTDPQQGQATYRFREVSRGEVASSALGGAALGAVGGVVVGLLTSAGTWTAAVVGAAAGGAVMGALSGYEYITHPERTIEGSLSKHDETHYFLPDGKTEAVDLDHYAWARRRSAAMKGRPQWWDEPVSKA